MNMLQKPTDAKAETRSLPLSFRRLRRQRGQALPLAAIGLVIMTLAIIATLNLGQAVHEKIRLQNSADAAAYSMAAMQARAFNFIALTNRTQIVHYNTAMSLQSYLSYTGYCLGIFGTMKDLAVDLDLAIQTGCLLPPPANVPYLAVRGISQTLAQVAGRIFNILWRIYTELHDRVFAPAIEAMTLFNKYALWHMQMIRALQINAHLVTGMQDFVLANDPTMTYTAKNQWFNILINQVLNSLEFQATWDRGGGINPFWMDAIANGRSDLEAFMPNPERQETQEAYAIMTELANASRSHANIYNRSGGMIASWLVVNLFGSKKGMTKLIEGGRPRPAIDELRKDPINYPIGDTLGSDDYLQIGSGFAFIPPAPATAVLLPNGAMALGDGIIADDEGGQHYRYRDPGSGVGGGPTGFTSVAIFPIPSGAIRRTFNRDRGDDHHKWAGLSPFFKFKPSSDDNSDFNQPSTWMFLNKHHSAFQSSRGSQGRPWHYKFNVQFNHGTNTGVTEKGERIGGADVTGRVSLDTTIGGERNSYLFEGLNVVSRGMAYYHRPGVWKEPPNMFNPFWRARLAPVGAKLMNVFDRFLGSKIRTNSDSVIAQGIVNLVRNFVSDFFLRVVTSVMTH